jgi:hypothetical protein
MVIPMKTEQWHRMMLAIVSMLMANTLLAAPAAPIEANFTEEPVLIDGITNEKIWETATAYPLLLPQNQAKQGRQLRESGTVQLAWDDTNLYFAFHFEDSDLVAEGLEDGLHHYRSGDVAEVFLKPAQQTWYWELYVTPGGKKSSFWLPGRGRRGLESNFVYECGLRVAARNKGTLNDWKDRDESWTAEMAMPIADLKSRGDALGPDSEWLIFFNRYNFSRFLPEKEQTMCPPLRNHDNHLYEDYSPLKLIR